MTGRERAALIIRQAIDKSGECDAEIARRAKIGKSTLANAIKTGSIRVDTLFRIIDACGLEIVDIRIRKRSENKPISQIVFKAHSQA